MSDYRRLISYLYSYNNGVKSKNVGFAKTERKGGIVKLWINMKGAFAPEESFRVYFFVRRGDLAAGIDMGECVIHGGVGQFYASCREEELTVGFEELCGLYIMGNGREKIFASQWDDLYFSVDKIVLLKDIMIKKDPEEIPVWQRPIREVYISAGLKDRQEEQNDNRYQNEPVISVRLKDGQGERDDNRYQNEPDISVRSKDRQGEQNDNHYQNEPHIPVRFIDGQEGQSPKLQYMESHKIPGELHASEEAAVTNKTDEMNKTDDMNKADVTKKAVNAKEAEVTNNEVNDGTSTYDTGKRDMFFDGKEPVLAFSEDEIYDCVDIDLAELAKLPKEARQLMNNSFVNHGYFNFHHLLLGKKEGNVIVVGIPGVYNRREKMTANMLGFEKFKFSMRSDVKMNHFGYWYKEYQV